MNRGEHLKENSKIEIDDNFENQFDELFVDEVSLLDPSDLFEFMADEESPHLQRLAQLLFSVSYENPYGFIQLLFDRCENVISRCEKAFPLMKIYLSQLSRGELNSFVKRAVDLDFDAFIVRLLELETFQPTETEWASLVPYLEKRPAYSSKFLRRVLRTRVKPNVDVVKLFEQAFEANDIGKMALIANAFRDSKYVADWISLLIRYRNAMDQSILDSLVDNITAFDLVGSIHDEIIKKLSEVVADPKLRENPAYKRLALKLTSLC